MFGKNVSSVAPKDTQPLLKSRRDGSSISQFPLLPVNLALFFSLLPVSVIFRFKSLESSSVSFRWSSDIPLYNFHDTVDYRAEMFKSDYYCACFGVWSFQVVATLFVVGYHILRPHHPKYYSTYKNKLSIISHMVGGTTTVLGFYIGVLLNMKMICLVATVSGLCLHLPSAVWHTRQLHGQRELMVPSYTIWSWMLLQGYIDFFLYNGSYQTVFTCAMTMNTFAMVRLFGLLSRRAGMEESYNNAVLLAGLCNAPFIGGTFTVLIFSAAVFLWNFYFDLIKPMPRHFMRIERGYNDSVPDMLEAKRGIRFSDELERQSKKTKDKKEAIARALFKVLAGDDEIMDIQEVVDLYRAWGMPDAREAAYVTFKKNDLDQSKGINYEEFKSGFKIIIDGIHLKGEYDGVQDANRVMQKKDDDMELSGMP